jgi:enolase-phosphatase E1
VIENTGIRGILLDIEGTTTPIAFVHDVLFTYAREHVRDYVVQHLNDLTADITQLREEHRRDTDSGAESSTEPPPVANDPDSIATYVHWLIDRDRKSTGLKSLQGKSGVGLCEWNVESAGLRRCTFRIRALAKSRPAHQYLFLRQRTGPTTSFRAH